MQAKTPRRLSRLASAFSISEGFPVTIQYCGHPLRFDRLTSRVVLPYQPEAEMFVGLGLADWAIGRVGFHGATNKPQILPEQAAANKGLRFAVTDHPNTAPGWRNAQTVEDFARQLHPDAFK